MLRESAATRGCSPPATPGTFPLAAQPGAGLGVGAEGSSGRMSACLGHLFPQAGTGSSGQRGTVAAVRFLGKWPLWSMGTAVPAHRLSTTAKILASKAEEIPGDRALRAR